MGEIALNWAAMKIFLSSRQGSADSLCPGKARMGIVCRNGQKSKKNKHKIGWDSELVSQGSLKMVNVEQEIGGYTQMVLTNRRFFTQ